MKILSEHTSKLFFMLLLLVNYSPFSSLAQEVNPLKSTTQNKSFGDGKYYWVIYDNVCPYCREATKHIKDLDWARKFKFVSYRNLKTYKMFPFLKKEVCEKDVHMVTPTGEILVGYEVFRAVIDNLTATKILNPLLKNDFAEKKLKEIYEKMVKERTCYYDKSGTCGLTKNKKN